MSRTILRKSVLITEDMLQMLLMEIDWPIDAIMCTFTHRYKSLWTHASRKEYLPGAPNRKSGLETLHAQQQGDLTLPIH